MLSKFGLCSRRSAEALIAAGRVRVDGRVVCDAGVRVDPRRASIRVDGRKLVSAEKIYLLLNKPRGLLTTYDDPQDRGTVYDCLAGHDLPFVGPVGRLDMASEGLLLMTNDTRWASHLLDPASNVDKIYHVQIGRLLDETLLAGLRAGVVHDGERLSVKSLRPLRAGDRNAWLEVVLTEGRNRQIRRLMALNGAEVLRLVRVAIGSLGLGDVRKGEFRHLTEAETTCLAGNWQADAGLGASYATNRPTEGGRTDPVCRLPPAPSGSGRSSGVDGRQSRHRGIRRTTASS